MQKKRNSIAVAREIFHRGARAGLPLPLAFELAMKIAAVADTKEEAIDMFHSFLLTLVFYYIAHNN